jgi:hypothetical protein
MPHEKQPGFVITFLMMSKDKNVSFSFKSYIPFASYNFPDSHENQRDISN